MPADIVCALVWQAVPAAVPDRYAAVHNNAGFIAVSEGSQASFRCLLFTPVGKRQFGKCALLKSVGEDIVKPAGAVFLLRNNSIFYHRSCRIAG